MSRYVSFLLPQGIPTGGYTAADFLSRHNLAQWISLLDRRMFKPILDPSKLQPSYACIGDYCKSHHPYYVGPSFTITPLKGFLTHDGGISNTASSPVPIVFYLGAFDSIACYKQVFGLSKTCHGLNCYSGFSP